jgi:hypothetical protein
MNLVERNGRRYAYQARWVDGRCVKEYRGAGSQAKKAARRDAEARIQRGVEQQEWLATWSRIETAQRPLDALCEQTKILTSAILVLAGFYFHKGYTWRRRSNDGRN